MSSLGGPAQNITMPDPSGKSVSLSSFKGSPVILYFWASWCDSCRNHNAQLLTLYDKFKSKGLKIMAVSLDLNKEVWQAAIKKDKVGAWTHVSDLKYWNSPVVSTYNIENIPLLFLIDKEGTVISRSVSPSSMENSLNTLLK
ncbi:MAG TPA: TlpA disulfide reductase family protein [Bacteroidales bacterium]|nr:TlpA disulfide reductase family protein [Bacteroidales bacterium]